MGSFKSFLDSVDHIIQSAKDLGIVHLSAKVTNNLVEQNLLQIDGKSVVNFGSCSYLGLEFDPRLKKAAIEAIEQSGTQFSSSRSYISIGLYKEFEQLLNLIFEANCIVSPTTTLGHVSAIPVLVGDDDAVILDHQVHNSVQTAVSLLKPRGIKVELLRHNNMERLEESIKRLSNQHDKIWYMADGIYSMYGDQCPVFEVERLLNTYKNFHFYVDDAHGMSWHGNKGQGYVLSQIKHHDRMVVTTSLAKAFATGGGVLIFPNKQLERKVRNCGGPLIFSGPLQPANLGAAIACAKIHLSPEITYLQNELWENIRYTKEVIQELELPCVSISDSPVFFIGVSLPKVAKPIIQKLIERGHYLNLGIYPAVPMKNTGLRFTITRLHSKHQIKQMLQDMKELLEEALEEQNFSYLEIYQAFRRVPQVKIKPKNKITPHAELSVSRFTSIQEIQPEFWDKYFHTMGILTHETLRILEMTYSNNPNKEDNWEFEYIQISDTAGNPVLMTFLTISLAKDDMMASHDVSKEIEQIRRNNPYFLTSEILAVGTPITEGEQIYIDKQHPLWEKALNRLLVIIDRKQQERRINQVVIRDFEVLSTELETIFTGQGYIKYELPNNNYLDDFGWENLDEFKKILSYRSNRNFNRDIKRHLPKFEIRNNEHPTSEEIQHWYTLYTNISSKNRRINIFNIPFTFFEQIAGNKNWVVLELYPKTDGPIPTDERPIAVGICQKNGTTLNAVVVGLDYTYQKEHRPYNCLLMHTVLYAKEHEYQLLNLGYTADREKRKTGAKQQPVFSFIQVQDDFNMQVIMQKEMSL